METMWRFFYAAALLVAVATERSFVDTAPPPSHQQGSPEIVPETPDSNVRDLESLKQSIGKTLEMMKTQSAVYTNVNGHKESHSESQSEVKEDGKLLARVGQHVDSGSPGQTGGNSMRMDVDIPSKGIHKSLLQRLAPDYLQFTDNGNRRSSSYDNVPEANTLEKYGAYAGTQYSPLDMAEYVFWTGDEKGVTMAIEEFLQEGLMSREEAINFLQEIKYNLDYLQKHYTQLGLNVRDRSKETNAVPKSVKSTPELVNSFNIKKRMEMQERKEEGSFHTIGGVAPKIETTQTVEEYNELLERLRVADFLYTEYSLEEVIYQLAKVMFTQSLTKGSTEAQQALQKFTTFLENESEQGHISKALEKKVLDVLIASLTDTLNEHPELAAGGESPAQLRDGESILRQILQMSPEDKASVQAALKLKDQNRNIFDLQLLRHPVDLELKEKAHSDSLGKYKTTIR